MKSRVRKGQAAMEFLMTYGWAIFIVLAAVGTLAYFGVLSPDRFLPDKCVANTPFVCTQYKISGSATGNVLLSIQNNAGTGVESYSIDLTCDDESAALAVSGTAGSLLGGDAADAVFTCPQSAVGKRWRGNFVITYTNSGETISHIATGSLAVTVD